MLAEFFMIYLTKYIYFILIMWVKCRQNVLNRKFNNVGIIKNVKIKDDKVS